MLYAELMARLQHCTTEYRNTTWVAVRIDIVAFICFSIIAIQCWGEWIYFCEVFSRKVSNVLMRLRMTHGWWVTRFTLLTSPSDQISPRLSASDLWPLLSTSDCIFSRRGENPANLPRRSLTNEWKILAFLPAKYAGGQPSARAIGHGCLDNTATHHTFQATWQEVSPWWLGFGIMWRPSAAQFCGHVSNNQSTSKTSHTAEYEH